MRKSDATESVGRDIDALKTPSDLRPDGVLEISDALRQLLAELSADNQQLTRFLRSTHEVCDRHNDVATASLIENWIDETERRIWFLSETQHDI